MVQPTLDTVRRSTTILDKHRREALSVVDNAQFSWFHTKVCLVAGVGFFTDAYDIFSINIVVMMLGYVYGSTDNGGMNICNGQQQLLPNKETSIKISSQIGIFVGQLFFGWFADKVGRKRMYGVELLIISIATFAQALSAGSEAVNLTSAIVVWRVIMGIGIGGDYPLSSIIASEFAPSKNRGRMMSAVFACQGWGNIMSTLVALGIITSFRGSLRGGNCDLDQADKMWRLLIGIGCIPSVCALYFRLTIPETPRFTLDIERDVLQASFDINDAVAPFESESVEKWRNDTILRIEVPKSTWRDFKNYFGKPENAKTLFATAFSWFSVDVVYYGLGLNQTSILEFIGFETVKEDIYQNLKNFCIGNLILSVGGLIPGYWVAFFLIDSWGRKRIQLMGFSVVTVLLVIMGFTYDKVVNSGSAGKHAFIFLYCLANFFLNFGPNTTTFVIPGEIFPSRYRSTGHGISAASGKFGAIIGQFVFAKVKDKGGINKFVPHLLEVFALFTLAGVLSSLLLPETKGKSLEVLSNEPQEGFLKAYIVDREQYY